jgi:SagB-type dehydrogenase family enzyme
MKKEGESRDRENRGIGELFQEETKYTPEVLARYSLDYEHQALPYKEYEKPLLRISLPAPVFEGDPDIWAALKRRRSVRDFNAAKTMAIGAASTLLWATQGLTDRYGQTFFRTAPSAGGLYPVETYLHVRAIENLDPGVYHFRPHKFDLELMKRGDASRYLAQAALGQTMFLTAQLTFIWSAVIARAKWKYRQRTYRYVYLDAGHIAENLYLAAEALGIGACAVGAFYDDQVNSLLGLDGHDETVIYMAAVGLPA